MRRRSPLLAAAFVTAAVAALGPRRPSRPAVAAPPGSSSRTSIAAYAVDRTVGLPFLADGHVHRGVDALGLATKALEVVGLWGAIVTILRHGGSPIPRA